MLLFCDGFDAYTQMSDATLKGWVTPGTTWGLFNPTGGRYGGGSIGFSSNWNNPAWGRKAAFVYASGYALNAGFWLRQSGPPSQTYNGYNQTGLFGLDSLTIATVDPNGHFTFYPYGSSTGNAARGVHNVCDGQYHWVELQIVFKTDTTGSFALYVDEQPDLVLPNVQTVYAGSPSGALYLGSGSNWGANQVSNDFDDLILWDNMGTAYNTFPRGRRRISTLTPNADGALTQFTPSAGQNYACVAQPYGGTANVHDTGTGHTDLYQTTQLQYTPNTVEAAVINTFANNTLGDGSKSLTAKLRSGAAPAIASGASRVLPGRATAYQDAFFQDAAGAAWTAASVNAAQPGMGD